MVFISRMLPHVALDYVKEKCNVEVNEADTALPKGELIAKLQGRGGLISLLTDTIDEEVFQKCPDLRVVSNVAVGYNNIDVKAATRYRVMVTNTPGVLDDTTADFTWALLMATARRVVEADRYVREGKFTEWRLILFLGQDVHHKTLGIVGLGRIGKAVARRAKGFDMRILYTDVKRADEATERELGATFVDKETLLRESDFISLHVPLFPETTHYISQAELNMMKPTAILVNAARGPVVDEKALVKALKERQISGAGLDVFEREPLVEPGLLELDNVVLAPHIASASVETRNRMALMAAENCVAALTGKRPPNLVNSEVWQQ